MFIRSYKIVEPKRFETFIEDISLGEDEAYIKIDYAAICKADLRYYLGKRDKRILDLKYPISLIHEAIGTVLEDRSHRFQKGDKVALVPNIIPKNKEGTNDELYLRRDLGENYNPNAIFASSTVDGFSKEIIHYPSSNLVQINKNRYDIAYVFCELVSVCVTAIRKVDLNASSKVAVFGDGILGYILCCVIKAQYKSGVIVVGTHEEKLNLFTMCDAVYKTNEQSAFKYQFDTSFECVGGINSQHAINSTIDTIQVGGKIILTGVAEENIAINTRKILEKGLTIYGSTRSSIVDFETAVTLFTHIEFYNQIKKLIIKETAIHTIEDYGKAFEAEAANNKLGKYILAYK